FCTTSSIMPQKKNPDALEIMRARTSRVHGGLFSILSTTKSLISGHNADTQETKKPLMRSVEIAKSSLLILNEILKRSKFNKARMAEATSVYTLATDLADLLAQKG
ncbi:MAG: lyase family protein, partial [Candidatus Micrarchaeia archaeon]